MADRNEQRINGAIKAPEVRLISATGEMLGIMSTKEAIQMAIDEGLDLVEISPNENPPICKIVDYGKIKYRNQKKATDAKKKQKNVELKEIKMTPNIGKNDLDVKLKQAAKFFEKGHKVRFCISFRGREVTHADAVKVMVDGIVETLSELSKMDMSPKLEGRRMFFTMVPKK